MDESKRGPMSAQQFFASGIEGVTITAAQVGTGLAYTTVLRARDSGETCNTATARELERWSREFAPAVEAGAWIDAAMTLGLLGAGVGGVAP